MSYPKVRTLLFYGSKFVFQAYQNNSTSTSHLYSMTLYPCEFAKTYDRSNIKIAPLITDNKFYSIYTFQAFLFFCKIAYHLRFS